MENFTPRRLVCANAFAGFDLLGVGIHGTGQSLQDLQALFDNLYGFKRLEDPDHRLVENIAVARGNDLPVDPIVRQVGVIFANILGHAGSAGSRPHGAVVDRLLFCERADAFQAGYLPGSH